MQAGVTPGFDDALLRSLDSGKVWHDYFVIPSGTDTTIDLANLSDAWGAALSFTLIQWLLLVVTNPQADNKLTLSAGVTNGWGTDTEAPYGADILRVQDLCLLTGPDDGWEVSATSSTLLMSSVGGVDTNLILILAGQ